MAGYHPLPGGFDRSHIADQLSDFGRPLADRNSFANAALAAAEIVDHATFTMTRFAIFQAEFAINARDLVQQFPDHDTELAVAKEMALFAEMTREVADPKANGETMYEPYGPNIPEILGRLHMRLIEAMKERHG